MLTEDILSSLTQSDMIGAGGEYRENLIRVRDRLNEKLYKIIKNIPPNVIIASIPVTVVSTDKASGVYTDAFEEEMRGKLCTVLKAADLLEETSSTVSAKQFLSDVNRFIEKTEPDKQTKDPILGKKNGKIVIDVNIMLKESQKKYSEDDSSSKTLNDLTNILQNIPRGPAAGPAAAAASNRTLYKFPFA